MKKAEIKILNLAKKMAERSMRNDLNKTSCGIIFQPKVPEGMKNFKKDQKS